MTNDTPTPIGAGALADLHALADRIEETCGRAMNIDPSCAAILRAVLVSASQRSARRWPQQPQAETNTAARIPSEADAVLAALESGEWELRRHMPQGCFTNEANRRHAWSVVRGAAPYCTDDEAAHRVWTGATPMEALRKGAAALGVALPTAHKLSSLTAQFSCVEHEPTRLLPDGWTLHRQDDDIVLKDPAGIGWRYRQTWGGSTHEEFVYRFLKDLIQCAANLNHQTGEG